jgi:cytochrome c biogenesis protein CcdA
MWILQFLPGWIFTLLFFLGVVGYLIGKTFSKISYSVIIRNTGIALIFLGTYMSGAVSNNEAWLKKVAVLEKKVSELESKSANENLKIVEKIITKREVVKEKSADIIKYVDREVVKYDSKCEIPHEVVDAMNKAAKK